ncbi:retrotransposon protein, putative, ty1-copia subclass [Tanacetum coccineum]
MVASADRLKIGKCNLRLSSDVTSKEATLQVVYDVLKLTPFYKAFQVTADAPEIYMQEFWAFAYCLSSASIPFCCASCGSMETFRLLVSQLSSEWFGGLFVQCVLQDHDCQRIMGVIGTQEIGKSSRIDDEVVQDQRQRDDNDLQDERKDQPKEEEVEPRRSKRERTEKSIAQWKESIKSEIDYILQNHTWELVDLLLGCKPLGYRWIFKKNMKVDGTIDKYKERLAIKGFRQQEGLYYFDTYSTRITPVKMILAIVALRNGEVHQMDVKMTFLNGDLEKVLYMNQPEGFMTPGVESKVCRLVKSLYSLREAPKQWHQIF